MSRRVEIVILSVLMLAPLASAEVFTSRVLLQQQDQWNDWATEEQKVLLTGRYEGRSGSRLRLQKLEILFFPERGVFVPERIRFGTPLSISGYFVGGTRKPEFRMTRLTIEPSDLERLNQRLPKIPESDPQARYQLANRYDAIAKFYADRELQSAVDRCRIATFEAQRRRHRDDAKALWNLIDPGPGFEVAENVRQLVRFQALCVRAAGKTDSTLIKNLKQYLPGWNAPAPKVASDLVTAFEHDRVVAYENADEPERLQLERLLYRQLRRQELRSQLKSDGSNALVVSTEVAADLPEETTVIRQLESTWADYRLKNIERLRRRQVDEVIALLRRIERPDDVVPAANKWLGKQEFDFRDRGSDGQLRLADDFLHASGQWGLAEQRERGIEYLKRAWTTASKESTELASEIEQRLARLGFKRLHRRWLTDSDLENLPAGDIEMAQQKGIVVPGMSSNQVEAIMGLPARRIRMATSTSVEDFWVYGERRSSRILVRMKRPRANSEDSTTVVEVVQISGL